MRTGMQVRLVRMLCVGAGLAVMAAAGTGCKRTSSDAAESGKVGEGPSGQGAAQSDAHQGGRVVLPSNEPRYLNPILETRFTRANLLMFEGLVGLSPSLDPVPVLAEKWDQSPDGKRLTFHLRKNVSWSDGKPFTSKDVAFTFNAIRTTTAPTLWKAYFASVDKLETPDPYTVVVTYSQPYAPALMAWTVGIIPVHVYGGGPLTESKGNREPVGTGPFRLERWEPGKRLIFEASQNWWHGRAHLDEVELDVDRSNQLAALRKGTLDFAAVPDVNAWMTEAQTPDFLDHFEQATTVGSLFRCIAWNMQRKPYDDKRVRLALTLALDRQRIIEDVLVNQAQAMSAPLYPNMYGSDPSIAPYPFDLDRATKLLDQAGHPAGPAGRFAIDMITVASQRTPYNEEMFTIFRRDLKGIGIDLKVEYLSPKDFEGRVVMRDFDAVFFGWFPDIPDPDPSGLLSSSQIKVGQNFAGYADPEADKLLEEAVHTANRDERKALYHKLHAKLHEDLPYTVLYAPYSHFAWSRRLHAVQPDDVGPQPRFPGIANWWVSP